MRVLLLSTYDVGHQPFGLASPAAWLRARGHSVDCADLSLDPSSLDPFPEADLFGFFLPMHTATRLAVPLIRRARSLHPSSRIACFGLYAPLNAAHLREAGANAVFGGEFETALADYAGGATPGSAPISLARQNFLVPDRSGLPSLDRYPPLRAGSERRVAGYTESSRGCKHLCRHCPVVPVYQGTFRIVPRDIVMEDIRRQVHAGARHITFGDPDFFNGPTHAQRIVEALHREFPSLSYDATIKIEHLLAHRALLPILKETGCLFVTSAVESVDDTVLEKLAKGHTRRDFIEVVHEFRRLGLTLAPTFIPFTPWTTLEGYRDLLRVLLSLDLVENVGPVQLALRLLIPPGSLLLDLDEIRVRITHFDAPALLHRWTHPGPSIDLLASAALNLVAREQKRGTSRASIFSQIWRLVHPQAPLPENFHLLPRAAIPYLDEPWYC